MEELQTSVAPSRLPVVGYVVLVVAALLTIVIKVPGGLSLFDADKRMILSVGIAIAFLLWLVRALKEATLSWPKSGLIRAAGLVLIVSFLATLFSENFDASWIGLGQEIDTFVTQAFFFVLLLLSSILFQERGRTASFYTVLLFGFFLLFLLQLVHVLFPSVTYGVLGAAKTSNLFGNWHDFGILAGLIALMSAYQLSFTDLNPVFKPIALVTFILGLLGVVFVNFTTVWGVLLFFSLVMVIAKFKVSRSSSHDDGETMGSGRKVSVILLLTLILSIVFAFFGKEEQWLGQKIDGILPAPLEVRPSLKGTQAIIVPAVKEDPILGRGPNLFHRSWVENKPIVVNQGAFWSIDFNRGYSHVLSAVATHGILGVIAWVAMLIAVVVAGLKVIRARDLGGSRKAILSLSFVLALYLWIFSFVYIPGVAVLTVTYLLTGVLVANMAQAGLTGTTEISPERGTKGRTLLTLVLVVLILATISIGYLAIGKYRALAAYQKSLVVYGETSEPTEALPYAEKAAAISESDIFWREIANLRLTALAREMVGNDIRDEEVLTAFRNSYQDVVAAADRARELDEGDYLNYVRLGDVYESVVTLGVDNSYELALQAYLSAEERSPTNPNIPFRIARLETLVGNIDSAKNYINKSLELKGNYNPAYMLASQIAIAEGDVATAIRSTELGAVSSPQDVAAFFQLGMLRFQNRQFVEAVPAFERAVILRPDYADAKYFLALSYYNIGQIERAIAQLEDVLILNPGNPEVSQMVTNLKAGRPPF